MKIHRTFFILLIISFIGLWGLPAQADDLVLDATETIEMSGVATYGLVQVGVDCVLNVDRGEIGAEKGQLELVANQIHVLESGMIDGRKMYGRSDYPDYGYTHGGLGGSYGGHGGAPTLEERFGTYGNETQPTIQQGTRGGAGPERVVYGGLPAGAIILRGENVVIDGEINFDGRDGVDWQDNPYYPAPQKYFGGGGASGGGILIIARNLSIGPKAQITANGGDGGEGILGDTCVAGYPGSGGRIKIFYEEGIISNTAVIETKAGQRPDFPWATGDEPCLGDGGVEDGTVYIEQVESIDHLLNPSDANGDGITDYKDLFLIHENWQKEVTPIPTAADTATPE